jgi:hypothetical protein
VKESRRQLSREFYGLLVFDAQANRPRSSATNDDDFTTADEIDFSRGQSAQLVSILHPGHVTSPCSAVQHRYPMNTGCALHSHHAVPYVTGPGHANADAGKSWFRLPAPEFGRSNRTSSGGPAPVPSRVDQAHFAISLANLAASYFPAYDP